MTGRGLIWDMLRNFGPLAPTFLLWFAGVVLALLRWRRHRAVSAAVLLACLLQILGMVTRVGLTYLIIAMTQSNGVDDLNHYFFLLSLLHGALSTLSWALLLLAVFGWRSHPGAAFARVDEDHCFPPQPR